MSASLPICWIYCGDYVLIRTLHLHNKIVWFLAANTLKVPDYRFLADRVYEVVKKYEEEVAKIPEDKLKELIVPPVCYELRNAVLSSFYVFKMQIILNFCGHMWFVDWGNQSVVINCTQWRPPSDRKRLRRRLLVAWLSLSLSAICVTLRQLRYFHARSEGYQP